MGPIVFMARLHPMKNWQLVTLSVLGTMGVLAVVGRKKSGIPPQLVRPVSAGMQIGSRGGLIVSGKVTIG